MLVRLDIVVLRCSLVCGSAYAGAFVWVVATAADPRGPGEVGGHHPLVSDIGPWSPLPTCDRVFAGQLAGYWSLDGNCQQISFAGKIKYLEVMS